MIRDARPEDISTLVRLGRLMHDQTNFSDCTYEDSKVGALIQSLIAYDLGIVLVGEASGNVVGGLVGGVFPQWFGPDLQANDYAFYVHPLHRGTLPVRLVAAFTKRARELGAKRICLGTSTGYELERTRALYEHSGYLITGYNFVHHIT